MTKTTIQISHKVREALGGHRITKRETYDEVLERLMSKKRSKKIPNPLNTGVFKAVATNEKPLNKRIKKEMGI